MIFVLISIYLLFADGDKQCNSMVFVFNYMIYDLCININPLFADGDKQCNSMVFDVGVEPASIGNLSSERVSSV